MVASADSCLELTNSERFDPPNGYEMVFKWVDVIGNMLTVNLVKDRRHLLAEIDSRVRLQSARVTMR